ncbi:MAG: RidA family protein [Proteobacteria bacterium]|nr:RidA family protein [Pseudomonadota bacterium]
MHNIIEPAGIAAPSSNYAHGIATSGADRWLHISGQVGTRPDGTLAGGSEAQMQECWSRIFSILDASGMGITDIVKVTVFLTDPADIGLYRQVRDRMLGGHKAASTLLIVAGLADPNWKVEIEAVAAA